MTISKLVPPGGSARPVTVLPELLGIVALAGFSLAPLVLSSGAEWIDWLVYQRGPVPAILTLEPLVGLDAWLHWLARALIAVGIVNVIARRVRPYLSYLRHMAGSRGHAPDPGTPLHQMASDLGCLSRIRVLPGTYGAAAFTTGLIRPRIYVSEVILEELDLRELRLLVLHEDRHRIARDPLRSFVATVLSDLFFWIPIARTLVERVILKIEFAADDAAAGDDRVGLAQTILKVAELGTVNTPVGVTAFAGSSVLASRVRRLIGGATPHPEKTSRASLSATVAMLVALWALGLTVFGTHNAHLDDGPDGPVTSNVLANTQR
jgi:beta-lactamase regulating signal transducer with metallopeptidase domain